MSAQAAVTIDEITTARGRADWLAAPAHVFARDPFWVQPLHFVERQRISTKHNPFFTFGEAAFFVAKRNGQPVGRISAQINQRHLAQHHDATGHFGFFDCIDDCHVATLLIERAKAWLRARGMTRCVGPFNLSINEDIGLLISGFNSAPAILSSHAPPWAGALLEQAGLTKAIDLYAFRMAPSAAPPQLDRLAQLARRSGRVTVREFDMAHYDRDIQLIFDVFNDAWSDNWGFVAFSQAEITAMIKETKPIMRGKFGRIAEIDGEVAAMMVALPDLNRVIQNFNGRLLPFNWAKLAAAIYRDRWQSARIPLLGVRKAHRSSPLAPAVLSLLVSEFLALGRSYDLDWVEFSWVLETNTAMVKLGELAAGKPSKTYRIYQTDL